MRFSPLKINFFKDKKYIAQISHFVVGVLCVFVCANHNTRIVSSKLFFFNQNYIIILTSIRKSLHKISTIVYTWVSSNPIQVTCWKYSTVLHFPVLAKLYRNGMKVEKYMKCHLLITLVFMSLNLSLHSRYPNIYKQTQLHWIIVWIFIWIVFVALK